MASPIAYHNQLLLREQALADDLMRVYGRSERRLRGEINKLNQELKDWKEGDPPGKFFQRERVQSHLNQIQSIIKQLSQVATGITSASLEKNVAAAMADAEKIVGSIGVRWTALPRHTLLTLTERMTDGTPLSDRLAQEGAEAAERAKQVLFDGIVKGHGSGQIGKELVTAVVELTRDRAILIARTESIRAYRQSSIEGYRYNRHICSGWRWVCSKSWRTCPACLALDGSVHPLEEDFGSHPACRCTPVPIVIGHEEWNHQTGVEWFDKQPESIQRRILGRGLFGLYKNSVITLDQLVDRHPSPWGPTANTKSIRQLVREGLVTPSQAYNARLRGAA